MEATVRNRVQDDLIAQKRLAETVLTVQAWTASFSRQAAQYQARPGTQAGGQELRDRTAARRGRETAV